MKHHTIRKHLRSLKAWRSIRRTAKHSASFAWHLLRQALGLLRWLNPGRYIKRMDWYIIKKFIGTYIYSIVLIISLSIVFDVNENLAKFSQYNAPLKAIVFDYYANFVP